MTNDKSSTRSRSGSASTARARRAQRSFPAATFEDALFLANEIQRIGSGQKVRRLTLFDELGKSPESGPSRQLVTNSSRYGLTKGSYQSEWLELTPDGNAATSPESSPRERLRARFKLAIADVAPFNALFERFVGNKLPSQSVMQDHLAEGGYRRDEVAEAVETFIVNTKFIGILRPVSGVERLLPLDHVLDELPASGAATSSDTSPDARPEAPTGKPATAGTTEWSRTCFYIAPIGDEDSDERRHSDVFLGSIVEPAIEALDRGFHVVRADQIDKAGMITAQTIEHIFKAALVVADLSFHNPNVFYELALRHATGKPTVQITRATDRMPFDVADVRTVQLDTTDIPSFVPEMETWKAAITRLARQALDDADGGSNPLSVFYPNFRAELTR